LDFQWALGDPEEVVPTSDNQIVEFQRNSLVATPRAILDDLRLSNGASQAPYPELPMTSSRKKSVPSLSGSPLSTLCQCFARHFLRTPSSLPCGSCSGLRALLISVGSTRRLSFGEKAPLCSLSIAPHWAIGAEPRKASQSSPACHSHRHLPGLSVLASGVFRFDATALIFCDCEVARHLHPVKEASE
jgi:hypothetical protein